MLMAIGSPQLGQTGTCLFVISAVSEITEVIDLDPLFDAIRFVLALALFIKP
jgi:hypothetical protein